MSFTELTFLFGFFPIVTIPCILLQKRMQGKFGNILLLVANIAFYFFSGSETLFMFISLTFLTYLLGNLIYQKSINPFEDRKWIVISVSLAIALIVYFKLNHTITDFVNEIGFGLHIKTIRAPLGISFLIFESISYFADIYRKEATPGSFLDTMIFLSMFPKLLSGPIVQWKDFQQQIYSRKSTAEGISEGIERIIIGYAKKIIIADSFGSIISSINSGILATGVDTQTLWLKYLFYFFQIYYDFSGYSDIAIGLCKIYGFNIKENFNFPYLSQSISEFWRRWHISLGTWFREYVYIPMGGNRKGNVYFHLLIVFILTGIWHGIGMPFLLWGLLNGIIVIVERMIQDQKWYRKTPKVVKWITTIIMLYFLWMTFSTNDLRELVQTIKKLFTVTASETLNFTWEYYLTNKALFLLVAAFIGSVAGLFRESKCIKALKNNNSVLIVRKIILILLFILDIMFMVNKSYSPFIYFRF